MAFAVGQYKAKTQRKRNNAVTIMVNWKNIDTVLLDMDGTLLDLAFDQYFWRELIPRCLARSRNMHPDEARDELFALYADVQGRLEWYCLDYWSDALELDLRMLKAASSHRVRFLPGARDFLNTLRQWDKRIVLVTNAHGDTLAVKNEVVGLRQFVDEFVTSHELGFAKEQADFWPLLQDRLGFDPARTLFADDSAPVLDAAARYGLNAVIAITGPNTAAPDNEPGEHLSVQRVFHLI